MKVVDINDELFELNGITYSKGDYILEIDSRNTYRKDGNAPYVFITNKYTNKSVSQDSIPFNSFKKEDGTNFTDLKELSYFISEAITLKQPPKKHSLLILDDGSNPHGTTKSDVGLSNVDNTSDIDKPVSIATQNALDLKEDVSNKTTDFSTINDILYPSVEAVKEQLDLKETLATSTTGTVISFNNKCVYNTASSPGTGNITDDLTGAKIRVEQKIYHNDGSSPTFPAGWVNISPVTYVTSTLNIIYAEWCEGTRVEYYIKQ